MMSTAAALSPADARTGFDASLVLPISWRNLWRNRRRTALTAGGIAFAVALLAFTLSMQLGSYATMIDNATALLSSHLQIQRSGFRDDPRIETTIARSKALAARIARMPGVRAVTERIEAHVLVSAGERSFAGELLGVDPAREEAVSDLSKRIAAGRYLAGDPRDRAAVATVVEVFAGATLAKNLGTGVGDEVVILGTDAGGGVAAIAGRLVGTFATGEPELDRSVLEVPIDAARAAFALGDEAHAIVVRGATIDGVDALARRPGDVVANDEVVLGWRALLPELEQAIELDRTSGRILFGLLAALVAFSVVSSFVIVVFERTHEFGVLLAIGMKPWRIVGMLELEAFWLALLGVAVGVAVAAPLVLFLSHVGISMGEAGGRLLRRFYMSDRLYPAFDRRALIEPIVLMVAATLVAAFAPSLRVHGLTPVRALYDR